MSMYDELAKKNNLSRRTHSFNMDKDGYLTVTTEVATVDNIPRSELYQNVFKAKKSEIDTCIRQARDLATRSFLNIDLEESKSVAKAEIKTPADPMAPVAVDPTPVAPLEVYEAPEAVEKPKKKRAPRRKKIEATPAVEDDGLGILASEPEATPAEPEVFETYEKGNKVHGKHLASLLSKAYGNEWQTDERVKTIVRGLVAAIKDVVPVVDGKGNMLPTFPVFVAEYLKKAA